MPKNPTVSPVFEYKKWRGIDNLTNNDIDLQNGFARVVNNVDVDDEYKPHLRTGILQSVLSGNCHSLWVDQPGQCFVVRNDALMQLIRVYKDKDNVWQVEYVSLLSGLDDSDMHYVTVGDRVFFSNLSVVGYVRDHAAHGFPVIDNTLVENSFKKRMFGGEFIEFFNSRLYVSQSGVVYYSDPASPMVTDERMNALQIGQPINMLMSVEDGLYIGTDKCVIFAHYNGETSYGDMMLPIPSFSRKDVLDTGTIHGSGVQIGGMDVQKGVPGTMTRKVVIFSTEDGIYMGLPSGYLRELTPDHYGVIDIEKGMAMVTYHNGYSQYILMAQSPAEITGTGGEGRLPGILGDN